jgi:serine/threonine-protein kinase
VIADDRYKLGEVLGTGATSEVFVATDTKLRRDVAFKRLLDHVAEDPTVRKSFHREAQALAKLRHKNVVAVHDYSGPESPVLFLVMDLVRGKNLSAWLKERGRLDEPIVWSVLHELAAALEACHAQGVVHRDLKPENVIVNPNGRLILVDFGVARSYDAADGVVGSGVGTQVMGTPDYMSPEQATSSELTGASDVFSLGSVLYFLCTAKPPFSADGVLATLKKIAAGAFTPIKQARPELSQALATLVETCLQPQVSARPSAKEIAADARRQLAQMAQKPDALLADWVAAGAHGTAQKVRQKELERLFKELAAALQAHDKGATKRCRKRILELDPDNEQVFEARVTAPAAKPPPAAPIVQPAPPARTPWGVVGGALLTGCVLGAAIVAFWLRR